MIVVGDLVLMEILQGARSEGAARKIELTLTKFGIAQMSNADIVVRAAGNYRKLRSLGVTVRKTIDVIIATFCLERGCQLLHQDRDFDPFEQHLGLEVLRPH